MNPNEPQSNQNYNQSEQPNWNQFPETQPPHHQNPHQPQHHEISQNQTNNNQHQPHRTTNPSSIVLQWLTYAFWGWTVLAMSILTSVVFYSFFGEEDTGSFTVYIIAAVLVLLPISAVTDKFYSKIEPTKKTGPESIVQVIHAVIFALFGIGALISSVFALVSYATTSGETTWINVTLFSGVVIFVLYLATFLRTLNTAKYRFVKKFYMPFMVASVGVILLFGIIGPLAKTRATKNDRFITDNIYSVNDAIGTYARTNSKLPEKLSDLNLKGDAKELASSNLIEYTPNTKQPTNVGQKESSISERINVLTYDSNSSAPTYYYEICATFKKEKKSEYGSSYENDYLDSDGYTTYLSIYEHDAGKQCYKIKKQTY